MVRPIGRPIVRTCETQHQLRTESSYQALKLRPALRSRLRAQIHQLHWHFFPVCCRPSVHVVKYQMKLRRLLVSGHHHHTAAYFITCSSILSVSSVERYGLPAPMVQGHSTIQLRVSKGCLSLRSDHKRNKTSNKT